MTTSKSLPNAVAMDTTIPPLDPYKAAHLAQLVERLGVFVGSIPGEDTPVFCFSYAGMEIYDISLSECGRFEVEPSNYGLSEQDAEHLRYLGALLDEATNNALNAGCKSIQDALGETDGGYASLYFSDSKTVIGLRQTLAEYLLAQLRMGPMR